MIVVMFVLQCSKLLADNSVLPFYPSKFVLVTDILDNFGKSSCVTHSVSYIISLICP